MSSRGEVTLQQYKINVAAQMRSNSVPQHERLWSSNPAASGLDGSGIPQVYSGEQPPLQQQQQLVYGDATYESQRSAGHLSANDQFQQEMLHWQQQPQQHPKQQLLQEAAMQQSRQVQAYQEALQHQANLRQQQMQAAASAVEAQHNMGRYANPQPQQLGSNRLPLPGALPRSVEPSMLQQQQQQHPQAQPSAAVGPQGLTSEALLEQQQRVQHSYLPRPASASPQALQHHTPLTYPSDDPALRPRPGTHLAGIPQGPPQPQPYAATATAAPQTQPSFSSMLQQPPPPPPPAQPPSQAHHLALQQQHQGQQQMMAGQPGRSGMSPPPPAQGSQAHLASLLQQRLRAHQQAAIQPGRLPGPQHQQPHQLQQQQQLALAPAGVPYTGSGDLGMLPPGHLQQQHQHQAAAMLDLTAPPPPQRQASYPPHQHPGQQAQGTTAATAYLSPPHHRQPINGIVGPRIQSQQGGQGQGGQPGMQQRLLPSDALFQQRGGGLLPGSDPLIGGTRVGVRQDTVMYLAHGGSSGSVGDDEMEAMLARQVGTGGAVDRMLSRQEEDLRLARQVGGLDSGNAALDAAVRQRAGALDGGGQWGALQQQQQQQQAQVGMPQGYGAGLGGGTAARVLPPAAQHNANRALLAVAMQQLQRQEQLQQQQQRGMAMLQQHVQPPPPPPPQQDVQQQYAYRQLAPQAAQQHQQQAAPANEYAALLQQHKQLQQQLQQQQHLQQQQQQQQHLQQQQQQQHLQHQQQHPQGAGGRLPYDHPVNPRAASTSQLHWTPPPPPPPYPRNTLPAALSSLSYPPPPGVSRTRVPPVPGLLSAAPSTDTLPQYDFDRNPPPAPPPRPPARHTFAVLPAPSANDQQLADLLAQLPSTSAAPASHCTITTGVPGVPPPPAAGTAARSVETATRTASTDSSAPAVSSSDALPAASGAGPQRRPAKPSPFTMGPSGDSTATPPSGGDLQQGASSGTPATGAGREAAATGDDAADVDLPELLSSLKLGSSSGHQPLPMLQKPPLKAGSREDTAGDQQLQGPSQLASMPSSLAAGSWELSPQATQDPHVLSTGGVPPPPTVSADASLDSGPQQSPQQPPQGPRTTPPPPPPPPPPASTPSQAAAGPSQQGDLPSLPGSTMSLPGSTMSLPDLPSGLSLPGPAAFLDAFTMLPGGPFHQPPPPPPPPRDRSQSSAPSSSSGPASHPLSSSVTALSSSDLGSHPAPPSSGVLHDDYLNPVEPLPSPFLQPSPSSSCDPHPSPMPTTSIDGPTDERDSLTRLRDTLAPPSGSSPHVLPPHPTLAPGDVDSSQSPFSQGSAPLDCLPDLREDIEHPSRRTVDSLFTSLVGFTASTPSAALENSLPSFQVLRAAETSLGHAALPPSLASVPEAPDTSGDAFLAAAHAHHHHQHQLHGGKVQGSLGLGGHPQQHHQHHQLHLGAGSIGDHAAAAAQHQMLAGSPAIGMESSLHAMAKRREASLRLGDRDSLTWVTRTAKRPYVLPTPVGPPAQGGMMALPMAPDSGYLDGGSGDQWALRDQSIGLGALGR